MDSSEVYIKINNSNIFLIIKLTIIYIFQIKMDNQEGGNVFIFLFFSIEVHGCNRTII